MTMIEQVLDIKQMEHLKELGVYTSHASMCWIVDKENTYQPYIVLSPYAEYHVDITTYSLPTFTLQDILDLLPNIIIEDYASPLIIRYLENGRVRVMYPDCYVTCAKEDLIDAAYEMLCWCIENGHIKTAK